jgi:hypothetical protein
MKKLEKIGKKKRKKTTPPLLSGKLYSGPWVATHTWFPMGT